MLWSKKLVIWERQNIMRVLGGTKKWKFYAFWDKSNDVDEFLQTHSDAS